MASLSSQGPEESPAGGVQQFSSSFCNLHGVITLWSEKQWCEVSFSLLCALHHCLLKPLRPPRLSGARADKSWLAVFPVVWPEDLLMLQQFFLIHA